MLCLSEHAPAENNGLLPMWNLYGDQCRGAAIVIDTAQIVGREGSFLILASERYGTGDERIAWLEALIGRRADIIANNQIPDDKLHLCAFYIFQRLKMAALFTKHDAYREEKEWRVVYMRDMAESELLNHMIGYRKGPPGLEPKLKLKLATIAGLPETESLSLSRLTDSTRAAVIAARAAGLREHGRGLQSPGTARPHPPFGNSISRIGGDGCKFIALYKFLRGPLTNLSMADQKMRYRFVRAFIVEGLFARETQEIVLLDQPGEGRKFVLTSAPDPFLAEADVSAARGAILGSRITAASGPPPPPPLAPMDVILDRIRSERKTRLDGRLVLVCRFEGTTDAITSFPQYTEGREVLILSQAETGQITGEDGKVIDRAVASLFVADTSVVRCEPLAQSLTMIDAAGSERLVLLFDMSLSSVSRRPIPADKEAEFKSRFARRFNSESDLTTVTRLLSDSLLAEGNRLRGFLAAWTALEIFIKKFSTKVPLPPDDERRKTPALKNWFNLLCQELGVEDQTAKASTFEKVKDVREQVFHYGKDMDESAFPIEDTQNLLRAFLEKIR